MTVPARRPGLDLNAIARFGDQLEGEGDPQLVQAVVAPGSEFIGRSIRELDFSRQFHAVIAGLWRRVARTWPTGCPMRACARATCWCCGAGPRASPTWPRTTAS
jgi:hypothetical protein